MILECDIGNSRCKWRLLGSSQYGSFVYAEQGFGCLKLLQNVTHVRAVIVAAESVREAFCQAIQSGLGCAPLLAHSQQTCAGVKNAYENFSRLGVDRWSALVAAYKQASSAVIVVDAGSAMTVDVVNAQGLHLGGTITPGKRMMAESLKINTAEVRFDSIVDCGVYGRTTDQAVGAGIILALVGTIKESVELVKRSLGEQVTVLLTGGDAAELIAKLPFSVVECPDLVMDGLQWLLPVSED